DLSDSALATLNSRQLGNTSALGNLNLHYHCAGKPGPENVDNVGIVALNVLRLVDQRGKRDDTDILRLQVLVRVRNYRPDSTAVRLHLDVIVDGKLTHPERKVLQLPGLADLKDDKDDGDKDQGRPREAGV